MSVSNLAVEWDGAFGVGTSIHATGLDVEDLRHATSFRAETLEVRGRGVTAIASGLSASADPAEPSKIRVARAAVVKASVVVPVVGADSPGPGHDVASAAGSAAPASSSRPAGGAPSETQEGATLRSRVEAWKAAAKGGLRGLADKLASDARVEVGALEVKVQRGSDTLTLGPGPFEASMTSDAFVARLAPGGEGESGITFRLDLPFQDSDVRLDVTGGPISLAAIGVRENDLGLTQIDKTRLQVDLHLVWRAGGAEVVFEGSARATDLAIAHAKLADGPVTGLAVAAKLKGKVETDGGRIELEDSEFDVGAVQLQLTGYLDRREDLDVDVSFGIPLVSCQAFLDALPTQLIPVVKGMSAAGTLSLRGRLKFNSARPRDYLLDYQAANDCRVVSVPASVDVARFRGPFKRKVYGPDDKLVEIESGPGTPGWVSLNAMSRFLEVAVMTTEDAHFRTHRGFDHEAIRNSVRENLVKRKFVRGASTISMQLAKNLYLDRRKTVSRKLQELILTAYLEQALTKDQILELYLNVIEFGPMIYGAGPAAYSYFHASPSELSLGQALYLSSILPNPAQQHFGEGGRVSDGWMGYLHKLMKNAEKRRWISPEELEEGLGEWVVYGSPAPIRTSPVEQDEAGPEGADEAGDQEQD